MKKIVFCDTMIWYNVHQNLLIFDKTKYLYYGSVSNLADFFSSDKMQGTPSAIKQLKNAIQCVDQFADDVFMVDPISAGASNLFDMKINEDEVKNIRESYHQLLRYAKDEVNEISGTTIDSLIETKKRFQEGAFKFSKDLKEYFSNNQYTNLEKNQYISGNIMLWLIQGWNKIYNENFNVDNIKNVTPITVFVKTYTEFIKSIQNELPNKGTMLST